jgi:hypothetical protein
MKTDWASALGVSIVERCEAVPPGWKTAEQISRDIGLRRAQTSARLRAAIAANRAEVRHFRIESGSVTRPVPHYRILTGRKSVL